MISIAVGTVIAAIAASSVAAPTPHSDDALAAIQARAQHAIQVREDSLGLAADRTKANTFLTDAHRSALESTNAKTGSALDSLGAQIAAATSARDASAELKLVFTESRVYAVVVPQAAFVGATDRLTESAIPKLEKAYARLEPLAAKDPEAAQDVADMRVALDSAIDLTDGLAEQFLAVTPARYNDDPTAMATLRLTLGNATVEVRTAVAEARAAAEALR